MITAKEAHDRIQHLHENGVTPEDRMNNLGVNSGEAMDYAMAMTKELLIAHALTEFPLTLAQGIMIGMSVGVELGRELPETCDAHPHCGGSCESGV